MKSICGKIKKRIVWVLRENKHENIILHAIKKIFNNPRVLAECFKLNREKKILISKKIQ